MVWDDLCAQQITDYRLQQNVSATKPIIRDIKCSIFKCKTDQYYKHALFLFIYAACSYREHTPMPLKNDPLLKRQEWKGVVCSQQMNTYRANQWKQEARAHAGSDVSDGQDEPCWHALLVCFVRERQVSLRHADWQIAETLRGRERTKKMQ